MRHRKLTERDLSLLSDLHRYGDEYVSPMRVGGASGSWHSQVLGKLTKYRLVDCKKRGGFHRESLKYRLSAEGRKLIQESAP